MSPPVPGARGPVVQADRIDELDVLRGVALLGVLIANFVGFASAGMMATRAQLDLLPTALLDETALVATHWLITNKANTLFAVLFGLGFSLQIARNGDRPGFTRRYSRRLGVLFAIGILDLTLLWAWDILNLYAVAGFLLLAARGLKTRTLVIAGGLLALVSGRMFERSAEMMGFTVMRWNPSGDGAVAERVAASQAGNYPELVGLFWQLTWAEWLAGGFFLVWLAYALGRFLLGAAIGRSGILEDVAGHLPLLRRIRNWTVPSGLALALLLALLETGHLGLLGEEEQLAIALLESPSALLLAAGYAAWIVTLWHWAPGRRLLAHFRPVGQMALTNYLLQGLLYAFVLFGVGPGLALAGKVGSFAVVVISLAFFGLQMAASRLWLSYFRFGPFEWLWRWLTYGGRAPQLLRQSSPEPQAV